MGEESKVFSLSEVSAHNTVEDCWVIINAKVYNVTRYLSDHPGGDEVLLAAAGKDASEEFEDVGHGSAARLMLDEFYIGEVDVSIKANTEVVITPTLAGIDKKKKSLDPINKFLYFIVLAFFYHNIGCGISLLQLVKLNLNY